MLEALAEHFGEQASWTRPQGGLFIWATLDERLDTTDLLRGARARASRSCRAARPTWTGAAAAPRCA